MQTVEEHLEYGVMAQAYELMNKHKAGQVTDATLFYGLSALLSATRYWLSQQVVEAIEAPLRKIDGLPCDALITVARNDTETVHLIHDLGSGSLYVSKSPKAKTAVNKAGSQYSEAVLHNRYMDTSERIASDTYRWNETFTNYTQRLTE